MGFPSHPRGWFSIFVYLPAELYRREYSKSRKDARKIYLTINKKISRKKPCPVGRETIPDLMELLDEIEFFHPVPEGVNTEIQLLGSL